MAQSNEDIKTLMMIGKTRTLIQTYCGVCGKDITGKPDCPICSTKDWVAELSKHKIFPCPFCGCEAIPDPIDMIGWKFNHQAECIADHVSEIYWDDVDLREKWNNQVAMIELSNIKEELEKDALYAQPYRAAYEALIYENPGIIQDSSE